MSYTLVFNSSNVIGQNNSQFLYKFIVGNFTIKNDSQMCISSVTIPYSWYNIAPWYTNQTFDFTWTNGDVTTTYNINLPAGFYTLDNINTYLQLQMYNLGAYLINQNGQYVYYINMLDNITAYKVQVLFYIVPTSLPVGWSLPSNVAFLGFPTVTTAPSLIISNNGFQQQVGLTAGTYGGGNSDSSVLSNTLVNSTTVNSVLIRSQIVSNSIASPSDIIDSFPINSTFGSNITYNPQFEKWIKIKAGTYNSFDIFLSDQNFNTLYANDPNVTITILIKN